MGLDISLGKVKNNQEVSSREAQFRQFENDVWESAGEYDSLSEEEKSNITSRCQQFASELMLDKWGTSPDRQEVVMDSSLYPDHMFKIGYMRSSYNEGGINYLLRDIGLPTLYGIFGYTDDDKDYYFTPNWAESLVRVQQVIADFATYSTSTIGKYRAERLRDGGVVSSIEDAMKIFRKEALDRTTAFSDFSSRYGLFLLGHPLDARGIIFGKNKDQRATRYYLVYKQDDEQYGILDVSNTHLPSDAQCGCVGAKAAVDVYMNELYDLSQADDQSPYINQYGIFFPAGYTVCGVIPGSEDSIRYWGDDDYLIVARSVTDLHWYKQALDIVQETIEYVLKQPDVDEYYLAWSA